jgi:hypothetical protein
MGPETSIPVFFEWNLSAIGLSILLILLLFIGAAFGLLVWLLVKNRHSKINLPDDQRKR